MHDDKPLDLSALDPLRHPARWRAFVASTHARLGAVLEGRARQNDLVHFIVSWRRPLLATAAAIIVALIPAEILLERREVETERVRRLVAISLWPGAERLPNGADFRRALGGQTP